MTLGEIAHQPVGAEPLLSATNVTVRFGGLRALTDVSVNVPKGTIVGLVGPNGAGKSTLFGALSGLRKPNAGRVWLSGRDVTNASAQARARLGLGRTFQQPELFMGLTVREHLVLAYRARHARSRLWKDVFTAASIRRPDPAETERVDSLLELLSLTDVSNQLANALPLGTSRLLEVGRALAFSPLLVLMDEPLSGLDRHEAERLAAMLRKTVAEEQVSLLLVEHDVGMVLSLSSHIYVLDFGILIAEGPPDVIRDDPKVRTAYLGEEGVTARSDIGREPEEVADATESSPDELAG
ncbi:MAG TPA: ABC transporter ATP-binding protein [Acidimicrobiales bacterium]|jgi:ABC-type branched-subunit amino acid transport system ATPase component